MFEWTIQWVAHKYFTCSIPEWISWMNDSMTSTFLTVPCHHLVAKQCNTHCNQQTLFVTPIRSEVLFFRFADCYHRHQCLYPNMRLSQYICDDRNYFKTGKILYGWKDCECVLYLKMITSLSSSAEDFNVLIWWLCQRFNRQANCCPSEIRSRGCLNRDHDLITIVLLYFSTRLPEKLQNLSHHEQSVINYYLLRINFKHEVV